MVSVRHGSPRYRAFWMTAGLSAGAATWALAVEPVAQQVVLQPIPNSNVVQTQAQTPANSGLRTQQPGGAQGVRQAAASGPKSEVQKKLEELYAQDGREMPALPDPQIQRQAPAQSGAPKPAGTPAQPVSSSNAAQSRSSGGAQPSSAQPQYKTWADAQAAGEPRTTQAKKTPWIEQINPFKKRVPSTPPTEPAEIHYDPRHAGTTGGAPAFQPQGQVALQPGQINPQTGRPNYGQIFNQPQTYGTPAGTPMTPPQGDPFVATPPMAVAAAPQLTAPGQPTIQQPIPQQPAAILIPPTQGQPAVSIAPANPAAVPAPVASLPMLDFSKPVPAPAPVPAAAPIVQNQSAAPAPAAAPGAAFPVIDFTTPVPVGATPAAPLAGIPVATPAPLAAPPVVPQQITPMPAAVPQVALVPMQSAAPPAAAAVPPQQAASLSPFTGLGLNDEVPLAAVAPAQPAAIAPAFPSTAIAQSVPAPAAAALQPLVVAEAPMPLAAPPVAAAPQPAASIPKLDGFFSEEEDRGTPSANAVALPAQPQTLVVPSPSAEPPKFEVPKPADVAALPMPRIPSEAAPMPASLPKLELPPIVESTPAPAPAPAAIATTPSPDVVQPGSVPPLKPVPRQADPSATSKMARIAARADQRGLKGFCPVMLRDHRELVDSKAEYRSFYRNRIILLSSQEAKVVFESDPAKYAPASAGNDVIHLAQTGEELEGALDYAVWYKGRLYLFASAETLENFVAAPSSHATND